MPDSPVSTTYLLKRTELAVRACIEVALLQFDLTPNQFLMLVRLDYEGGQSSAQLARALGIRPQSITETITPLELEGLIQRQESPEHRRILQITLTAAGRHLLGQAKKVARRLEQELLAALAPEELSVLRTALEKLRASAEQHETHPVVRRKEAAQLGRVHVSRPWAGTTRPATRRRTG
jgi:DNA-binding MarR family transcriptional regulator